MNLSADEPIEYLRALGEGGGDTIDIAGAALMLAALDHSARPRPPYIAHLAEMAEFARHEARVASHVNDAARSLARLLSGHYGYEGDRLEYEDPRNADMMEVIARRRGLPVALGILYIHAARAAGFEATGLNSPGHFLVGIGFKGREALIDPFNGGAAIERERLNLPPRMGTSAIDDPRFADAVTDIDVLLRLTNNLKVRAIEAGDRERALEMAKRMVLIAPRRADRWLDLGHIYEAVGSLGAARNAFESCLALARPGQAVHNEAALGLTGLKRRLN